MKRSLLMSALVLALAAPLAACGGGTPDPKGEGDAKPEEGGGDPVTQLQAISDGIQKDVDAILQPIKDADAILDAIGKIPGELKAAKSKADWKKILAEVQKVTGGGVEADIESLGLDGDLKVTVKERFGKLKGLADAIKNVEPATKDLLSKITEALPKIPAIGAKAMAKIQVTLANPLAGGDAKKQAEADKAKIQGIIDGFKAKVTQWQADITALPAKAKDIPKKFAALK